jgi:hypothetical protein
MLAMGSARPDVRRNRRCPGHFGDCADPGLGSMSMHPGDTGCSILMGDAKDAPTGPPYVPKAMVSG